MKSLHPIVTKQNVQQMSSDHDFSLLAVHVFSFLGIPAFLVYKGRVAPLVRPHMNGLIPYEKTTEIMPVPLKQ